MFSIDGVTSAAAAQDTAPMPAVTFDVFTAFIVAVALVLAWLVYRWTAPAPGSPVQMSKGERLAYAIGAAASVIVIGGYLGGGFRGFGYPETDARPVSRDSRSAALVQGPVADGSPAGHGP
ncbi:hypothetical protein [Streptomyces chartreusis]|uniref:hypothetical protein n=1 Tax=Streptomyces chartreusis TaxID=1969 RepID=UPI00123C8853|nr:hypothetical protein [Streptomyces chartreusis]QEV71368.1 hypothetical protein CP983_35160 [Streptomyces chartreusis]GGX37924.1 hypothetical protein GCM10010321_62700 [Streptomyces chartreusis]